jgi:large subunit ribosomal protein L16
MFLQDMVFLVLNFGFIDINDFMLFIPKNSKYKKEQKGKSSLRINKNITFNQLQFGSVGLKAVSIGFLTSSEIKTLRQTIMKILKKLGRIHINVYPQTPVTKKPLGIRMGKGKGSVDHWVFKVRPGMILVEIETEFVNLAVKALKLVQIRLSINSKIFF